MFDDPIHKNSNYLKLLSNYVRLKIVIELSERDLFFSELKNMLKLKQSTLSNHVSKLKEYGIINSFNKNGFTQLKLNHTILQKYLSPDIIKKK